MKFFLHPSDMKWLFILMDFIHNDACVYDIFHSVTRVSSYQQYLVEYNFYNGNYNSFHLPPKKGENVSWPVYLTNDS